MFLRRRQFTLPKRSFDPDEILLDAHNLPAFERRRFEGTIETPIGKRSGLAIIGVLVLALMVFTGQLFSLQIINGDTYAAVSESNRTDRALLFAERGIIYDRQGVELAWNIPSSLASATTTLSPSTEFSTRGYLATSGVAHLIGYVTLPRKDAGGNYYRTAIEGVSGAEAALDRMIAGVNGSTIIETDALGTVLSKTAQATPRDGSPILLSIDSRVQETLHQSIAGIAEMAGFVGGAGVIINVRNGEILAMTSYPEFDPSIMAIGTNTAAIEKYQTDSRQPFLNRALSGLYTPGSIMKPFVALAALGEGVITPDHAILSTGVLKVPNPYLPGAYSTFIDWRAHGMVDMRRALAVSSNIYFYQVGGGFGSQKGVGIAKLEEYMRMFGIAQKSGIVLSGEKQGIIPTPAWKLAVFDEPWRLGDTYNTAIGQYGFLVTPLSMARATAALANRGTLYTPTILKDAPPQGMTIGKIEKASYDVVHEGMRAAVVDGTAQALKTPKVAVAGKTGTAQVGAKNEMVNSWVIGFFPYEEPRYAFAVILERAPAGPPAGAPAAMSRFFESLSKSAPEYLEGE